MSDCECTSRNMKNTDPSTTTKTAIRDTRSRMCFDRTATVTRVIPVRAQSVTIVPRRYGKSQHGDARNTIPRHFDIWVGLVRRRTGTVMPIARISAQQNAFRSAPTPPSTSTPDSGGTEQIVLNVVDPGVPYTLAPNSIIPGDIRYHAPADARTAVAGSRSLPERPSPHHMSSPLTGALVGAGIGASTLLRISTLSGNRSALWYLPVALLGGGLFGGFVGTLFS